MNLVKLPAGFRWKVVPSLLGPKIKLQKRWRFVWQTLDECIPIHLELSTAEQLERASVALWRDYQRRKQREKDTHNLAGTYE